MKLVVSVSLRDWFSGVRALLQLSNRVRPLAVSGAWRPAGLFIAGDWSDKSRVSRGDRIGSCVHEQSRAAAEVAAGGTNNLTCRGPARPGGVASLARGDSRCWGSSTHSERHPDAAMSLGCRKSVTTPEGSNVTFLLLTILTWNLVKLMQFLHDFDVWWVWVWSEWHHFDIKFWSKISKCKLQLSCHFHLCSRDARVTS